MFFFLSGVAVGLAIALALHWRIEGPFTTTCDTQLEDTDEQ